MKKFSEFLKEKYVLVNRENLPQIRAVDIPDFIEFLKANNVTVTKCQIPVSELLATQHQIDKSKVADKVEYLRNNPDDIKDFIVSSDNQILDSHHQLFALIEIDKTKSVGAYKLSVGTDEMIKIASKYSKATFKSITEHANIRIPM